MSKENSVKSLTSPNPALAFFVLLVCVLFFSSAPIGFAQTNTKTATPSIKKKITADKKIAPDKETTPDKKVNKDKIAADKPLHVTSDKMIAHKDTSMVEFIGNVKATRDDAVIFADSIKIFIHTAETKKQAQTDLKQIIATGNVEYTAGERKAFADKAVYTTQDEILILTGETARLITGKSHVTGKKITLFRNEDRAIVESDGKTRVQAIFNPEDQKPKK
jgi:lipopolysaccharide export system protein LptA